MIMYVGLPFANIDLEVNIKSYNKEHEYAGLYSDFSNIRKKITLNIKKEYSLDVIVSILAHEISHYFLNVRNISLENNLRNEKLTDTTAVYLGFKKYMLNGYRKFKSDTKVVTNNNGSTRTDTYTKIGYLEVNEINYIVRKLDIIKKDYIIYL